jgi:hypothetical protein
MPARRIRLLDRASLIPGNTPSLRASLDLDDAVILQIVAEVHTAGVAAAPDPEDPNRPAPALLLQHGPTADGPALDFTTPISIDLTAAGTTWLHADTFTPCLLPSLVGKLDAAAVVTLDVLMR